MLNKMNKKLFYLTYQTFPAPTANTIQTIDNLKHLINKGYKVKVVFPMRAESSSDKVKDLQNYYEFKEEIEFEPQELVQKHMSEESTKKILEEVSGTLAKINSFSSSDIELELRSLADSMEIKVGALLGTVRVATSGQKVSPPLFESLEVLGRDRVLELLRLAKSKVS